MQVQRVHADEITTNNFFSRFYETEQPVIISGVEHSYGGDINRYIWDVAHSDGAQKRTGHVATTAARLSTHIPQPQLVQAVFARDDIAHKSLPLKLWMHPRGHCTHLHYDGNSLHGFNWQLSGSKRWLLISPNTPTRLLPLSQVALTGADWQPSEQQHDFMEFTTNPGDMLFLPRYWLHQVTSQADCNVNLNWVWTPRQRNTAVALGRRECAVLKWRSLLGRFDKTSYGVDIHNYGNARLLTEYTRGLSVRWLAATLVAELLNLPAAVYRKRQITARMQEMPAHNFSTQPAQSTGHCSNR